MIVARDVIVAKTREVCATNVWDSLPGFMALHWDETAGQITTPRYAALDLETTGQFLAMVISMAGRWLREGDPAGPPVGYTIQTEAWWLAPPPPGSPPASVAAYERRVRDGTFHQDPRAAEETVVYTADIYGRLFRAVKRRGAEDVITERWWGPNAADRPSGWLPDSVMVVAAGTAYLAHGLPLPFGLKVPPWHQAGGG